MAEYALRTVICLAKRPGRAEAAREIARATGVPPSYQAKVLQALRRAHLVQSQRGLGGGFELALPPGSLTVQAVIDAVDQRVSDNRPARGTEPLPILRQRLREGVELMESRFASITIADLCGEGPDAAPRGDRPETQS